MFWFHGHYGYVPHRTFEDRTLKQFVPLVKSKNFIVVIPEMPWSIHTTTPTKRNSLLWFKPGDFMKFVSQVHTVLSTHNNNQALGKIDYKVVGHSAGGSTIMRLGITGDLCKINPSMVVWSDSSYGIWLDHAWKGCLSKNPQIRVKVLVAKWDSPYKNATRFMQEANCDAVKPQGGKSQAYILYPFHKIFLANLVDTNLIYFFYCKLYYIYRTHSKLLLVINPK